VCPKDEQKVRLLRILEMISECHSPLTEILCLPWTGGNTCYVDVVLMALAGRPHAAFDIMLDSGEEGFVQRLTQRYQRLGPEFENVASDAYHGLCIIRSVLRKRTAVRSRALAGLRDTFIINMARFDPSVFRVGRTGSPGEVLSALPWVSTPDIQKHPSPVFCIHEAVSPFLQKTFSSLLTNVNDTRALILVNDSLSKRILTLIPAVSLAIPVLCPKRFLYIHAVICSTNQTGDDGHYVAFLKNGPVWYLYDGLQPTLLPKIGHFSDLICHPLMRFACVYFYAKLPNP
jgi:hypothetical protein